MAKTGTILLTLVAAAWVSVAGAVGPGERKEALVQGKPLSYWLKELKDLDPLVREEALVVLAGAGEAARGAAPVLAELLKDKSTPVRIGAAALLAQFKGHAKEAAPVLLEAYKNGSRTLRHQILPALGPLALENEECLLLLLRASDDAENQTRFLASLSINKSRPAVFTSLVKVLDHADPVLRRQAVIHLNSAGKEFLPSVRRMLKDDDWDTRFWAAHALARIDKNPRAVLEVMVEANTKDDPKIRRAAWETVLSIKPPAKEALAIYKTALKEGVRATKVNAAEAVWQITRKADDVVPVYREVLENLIPGNDPVLMQVLTAIKQMGPEAKSLRFPLLEILKQGKDTFPMYALPPVLAALGPDSIPALVEVAGKTGNFTDQIRARTACRTLGQMGRDGLKPLLMLTEHQNSLVRGGAYSAMQLLGPVAKDAIPALRKALKHEWAGDRTAAAHVLGRLGPDAKDALADLLEMARRDKLPGNRVHAFVVLPHLQPPREDIRALLNDALDDPYPLVRLAAADWLWHLDPSDARPVKVVADALKDQICVSHALRTLVHHRDAASPAFPAVVELMNQKSAFFRAAAIQAVDELGADSKEFRQMLMAALGDSDDGVKLNAARALHRVGVEKKAAVDAVTKILAKGDTYFRPQAFSALTEFGPSAKDAVPTLERLMPAANPVVLRVRWIETLIAIDPNLMDKWRPDLDEAFEKQRYVQAAWLLARHYPKESKYVEFLIEQLQNSVNPAQRMAAAASLANGGAWAGPAVPALRQTLEDSNHELRFLAATALAKLEPAKHPIVPVLIEALRAKDDLPMRSRAANALAKLGPAAQDAVPALSAVLRDPEPSARFAANEALWKIDPKSALPCVFAGY